MPALGHHLVPVIGLEESSEKERQERQHKEGVVSTYTLTRQEQSSTATTSGWTSLSTISTVLEDLGKMWFVPTNQYFVPYVVTKVRHSNTLQVRCNEGHYHYCGCFLSSLS